MRLNLNYKKRLIDEGFHQRGDWLERQHIFCTRLELFELVYHAGVVAIEIFLKDYMKDDLLEKIVLYYHTDETKD